MKLSISSSRIIISILLVLFGAIIGAAFGYRYAQRAFTSVYDRIKPIRAASASYPLINPLLSYDIPSLDEFRFDTPMEKTLGSYVQQQLNHHAATNISVYYRELLTGHWIGINENTAYNPASLMKIAIVIAYYRQAQSHPEILKTPITYTKKLSDALAAVPFQTPSGLVIGRAYTIDQLIDALMIQSDNGAKNALLSRLDGKAIAEVYTDLGITNPDTVSGNYTISSKAYSLFFRILYNATYLNREYSERVLDLLTRAQYKDGIVTGVPPEVTVAQKFGEYVASDASGDPIGYELHDCGIVYHPSAPYILCVMTRGSDLKNLTGIIQQISHLTYQH